ncbi:MAG: 4-hydroxythreonine-4-phosphate dehydrogenase PdxA [Mangrovibacterium sp.]
MSKNKIIIGITQGDINGIGYEVIMKTLSDQRILEMCTPVVYGSPKVAAYHRKALNMEGFNFNSVRNASEFDTRRVNLVNCTDDNIRVELGKISGVAGEASYMALERAVNDIKAGVIDALVTAPISKDNIQSDKFDFPGHTEFLARQFDTEDYLMLMVSEMMKIGVVTTHVPVSEIAPLISRQTILKKLRIMAATMEQDFSIKRPGIAVLGLNPHAGDGGLLGKEEQEIIIPAIEEAKKEGILAIGPFPADGFFGSGDYVKFDAILAMYHDQGMVPFKVISFEQGVNYTAGLPVIRTSPAHGTAFDIAGEGKASPDSFRQALYLAVDVHRNRRRYKEISSNPLKKFEINPNQVDENIDLTDEEPEL